MYRPISLLKCKSVIFFFLNLKIEVSRQLLLHIQKKLYASTKFWPYPTYDPFLRPFSRWWIEKRPEPNFFFYELVDPLGVYKTPKKNFGHC